MFRRLQWKLVVMFVALVSAIMLIVGTFLLNSVVNFYQTDFKNQIERVLNGEFSKVVSGIVYSDLEEYGKVEKLKGLISAYSGQLGINSNRNCYILNAKDASKIASSEAVSENIEKTPNIISAMTKSSGSKFQFRSEYMDYAYYLSDENGGSGYIIYIKDSKQSLNDLIKNMMNIILQSLLFGLIVSIVLGFFLSKTITTPISILTKKANDFAKGDFDSNLEVTSKDEIGKLVETFNYMGRVMSTAMSEIAAEKHKIEIILEHVNNGIIAFNSEQDIIHINSTARKLLGIGDEEYIKFDEYFTVTGADVCMAEFLYLKGSQTEVRDIPIDDRHIRFYFVPFRMDEEKIAGVVCVLQDFTEQFNLELSRRKFVAEVSHELKTPLTTIRTYTETLLNGFLDDKVTATSFLNTIQDEADKMTSLVQNLLILSRFDAQKIEMKKELFSLDDLLRKIISTFEVEVRNQSQKLTYNKTTELPKIYADSFEIERVIKNIVSNSIKYTGDGGEIKIFAGFLHNEVYIKIEDNGEGIPEEDLKHVFERFYRVDKARTREKGGTGLGLSIAKEIIEKHGGSIKIESEFTKYTRVTIKLPLNNNEEELN